MSGDQSPFKFLDPYTLADRDIFFGRDDEIDQLYNMVFKTDLLMVYGQSGTGKTSLIQCGLASRFKRTDWHDIFVRRRNNINRSLRQALRSHAKTEIDPESSIPEMVESLFLDYFRPIYLLFDQFEELFILGTKAEQDQFIQDIKALLEKDLSCKVIIILREEYLGHLYDFEKVIPELFNKRLRVEPMSFANVKQVIQGSCEKFGIGLKPAEETVLGIIDNISDGKAGVQLSYLQVYLDRLYQEALHV